MRSPVWRAACALAVVVAALTVSGCDTDDPTDPPTPRPTSTPLFDSDEEALAAAEEAYGRYQAVESQILRDGGNGSERIEGLAVREALQAADEGFADYRDNGYRNVGATTFDIREIQYFSSGTGGEQDVVGAYVCLDFSAQDVVNSSNVSVVRPGRALRQAFEVSFDRLAAGNGLVLASREPWRSNELCES